MKKRAFALFLTLALCTGLLAVPASAAEPEAAKTSNIGYNNYDGNWARDRRALLYENAQGGLTRVECYTEGKTERITVETYDKNFRLLASKQLSFPAGFSIWGGAFHGEQYNYLMVGSDDSKTENKAAEVIRVIQYDQDWNELGHVGLTAGETGTILPFGFGTSFTEAGDYLHIHTARTMGEWVSNDGRNHESNLYITVNQKDLSAKVVDGVYVSHSFGQLILVNDEGRIVTANHGDMFPRTFQVSFPSGSAQSMDPTEDDQEVKYLDLTEFTPAKNEADMADLNQTDAELGGMADAGDAYVVAYKNVTTRYDKRIRGDYQNLYMVRIPKDDLTADGMQTIKLTDETLRTDALNSRLKEDGDLFCSTPVLVPTGRSTGYVMWTNLRYTTLGSDSWGFSERRVTDQLFILPYDAATAETFAASMARKPIELKGNLSDCQPFVYNGNVVWYATGQFKSLKETHGTMSTRAGYETTPVFYVFDGKNITAYQDGKKVNIPDAFWTNSSSTPTVPDDPAVKAALEKDAKLVEDFTKNNILTDVWSQSQFQSAMNSLMKQNADPATGEQTKANVWYYEVKDDHIDIQLTLNRAGQELKIDKILSVRIPSTKEDDELDLTSTTPGVAILPLDRSEVQDARNYLERVLKDEFSNRFTNVDTADSVLETAKNILKRTKVEVSWGKTGFSMTPATESQDGRITGHLIITCGTARCGLALDVPVKTADPLALIRADSAAIEAAVEELVKGNNVTEDSLERTINGAILHGSTVDVFWDSFRFVKANAKSTGSLTVSCVVNNGDTSRSLNLEVTVPVVTFQKPDAPSIPATGTAYPSTQTVTIDGRKVEFQMYALRDANGNPTNYVKVRDLALALNGSKGQFSVDWDGAVNLTAGKSYASNGSENQTPFSGERSYTLPANPTKVNGADSDLTAIFLVDDAGGGYTYYQLRDLGRKLGFNVDWSAEMGIFLETDKPYNEK